MKNIYWWILLLLLLQSTPSLIVEAFAPTTLPRLVATSKQQRTRTTGSLRLLSTSVRPLGPLRARNNNNSDYDSQSEQRPTRGPVVNLSLVRQTILNQGLIGFTIWTGGPGAQALAERAHFDTTALLLAIAGVLPLMYVSRQVETSESPAVADLNVSTNMLVLRMFGDKPQPIVAFVVSAVLAGLTGLVEETTFRGQLLPAVADSTGSIGTAIAASTVVFAVLHLNPLALLRGGSQGLQDGAVLIAYQLVTGAWFALLFVGTGNLAVSIGAHALFDFYVFFATHLIVTQQMEYAREQSLMPSNTRAEAVWQRKRGDEFVLTARETFYLADTNKDGVLSREELRIAVASYGIRLSAEQSAQVLGVADADASGYIDFGEFLDFVGPAGSPGKAIKNSLLGVNG